MKWTWRDELIDVFKELGGVADYEQLESAVKRRNNKIWVPHSVRQCIEDHSSDSISFRAGIDIFYSVEGIGKGVWGLREYQNTTPKAIDINKSDTLGNSLSEYRVLSDTTIARELKALYNNCCQICNKYISLPGGLSYSEAHHIRPIGDEHQGHDVKENIVILCPNHHAEFDYGARAIEPETLKIISFIPENNQGEVINLHKKHTLDIDNLYYSYINIFNKKLTYQ